MANRPIYAGSYQNRRHSRAKVVFFIIVLVHFLGLGAYLSFKKGDPETGAAEKTTVPEALAPAPSAPASMPSTTTPTVSLPETRALIADARSAIDAGRLADARAMLDNTVASHPDPKAIELLGKVNMQLLKSPMMMPGKEYYVIQSGDYLQKIAKRHNITVALLKTMNGLKSDTIRLGDRMLVFNGNFSIHVSKSRNELDLLLGKKLFKRYSVGTGKFGKTPAVEFTLVDKIVEPPWTRPSDNKKIEYGDPENVLGSRWMAIKSENHPELTGFGIHGTWERDSIGKQSSAGCIRMLNEDVEELFDLVPRKTSIIISE